MGSAESWIHVHVIRERVLRVDLQLYNWFFLCDEPLGGDELYVRA